VSFYIKNKRGSENSRPFLNGTIVYLNVFSHLKIAISWPLSEILTADFGPLF